VEVGVERIALWAYDSQRCDLDAAFAPFKAAMVANVATTITKSFTVFSFTLCRFEIAVWPAADFVDGGLSYPNSTGRR
jgi:hypothetical protein